ncbi:hypothetical protein Tco_0241770 [Tanacetum coccineum]
MNALLEQRGLAEALEELPAVTIVAYDNVIQKKVYITLILCLGDRILREITKEMTATGIWKKLETLYMTKSLANRLYLKKKLYTFQMHPGTSQPEHIDEFHKLLSDLAAIDTAISDEDQALLLLTFLPSSYDNFVETLLYGRDTLKLEDVLATLNSRELQKMTEAKDDGGEGLYVRGRSGQRDMEQGTHIVWSKSQGSSRLRNEDQIMDSEGSYHMTYKRDYLFDFEECDGGNVLLGYDRECRVLETGKAKLTLGTLKKEGFTVKMRSGKIKSGMSKVFVAEDTTMSTYLVNRTPSSRIGSKTPIDMLSFLVGLLVLSNGCLNRLRSSAYSWDTVKVRVRIKCCNELSLRWNCRKIMHLRYRKDSNEATFVVAAVEKIYAHESLTFNDTLLVRKSSDDNYWEYAPVGSQEYQVVCTRPGIASSDVDILDGFDHAAYMTLTEAAKEAIWLKRLAIESGFELKIVAGIATGALSKAIPGPRFQHRLNLLEYRYRLYGTK